MMAGKYVTMLDPRCSFRTLAPATTQGTLNTWAPSATPPQHSQRHAFLDPDTPSNPDTHQPAVCRCLCVCSLVVTAAALLGVSVNDALEAYGLYFVQHVEDQVRGRSSSVGCGGGGQQQWRRRRWPIAVAAVAAAIVSSGGGSTPSAAWGQEQQRLKQKQVHTRQLQQQRWCWLWRPQAWVQQR